MKLFPLFLGLRNLCAKNGRLNHQLLGSIIGIALSLIPLIVVLEVADGMIEGITRRYLELGTYHLQVILPGDYSLERYQRISSALRYSDMVLQTIIERQGMGMLYSKGARSGVTIRAVPASLYSEDTHFRKYMSLLSGSFDLEAEGSILLGKEVAARLKVEVGDKVKLLTILGSGRREEDASADSGAEDRQAAARAADKTGYRYLPMVSSFLVTGIFSTGYQELDKLWTYIPLKTGIRILSAGSSSQFLGVKVHDPYQNLEQQIERLEQYFPPEARIYTWYGLEKANYKSFQTTKALLTFIMVLIVLVAAVNISSSLVMVVLEKTQEIGILKAIGAYPRDIRLAFLFTGLITGLAGTILGLGLGILIAVNINQLITGLENVVNLLFKGLSLMLSPFTGRQTVSPIKIFNTAFYLEQIPIRLGLTELILVALLSLVLSASAAYLPARSAGRIKPMEIIRKY